MQCLTWTKNFINFHPFENSPYYYPNNEIQLKLFEFPQNITLPQNIPITVVEYAGHPSTC